MPAATLRRISMKAFARYQVILLGEQRHIRCEQLAQGGKNIIQTQTEPNYKTEQNRFRTVTLKAATH